MVALIYHTTLSTKGISFGLSNLFQFTIGNQAFSFKPISSAKRTLFNASHKVPFLQPPKLSLFRNARQLPSRPLHSKTEKLACFYSCEDLYKEWKQQKRFLRLPKSGVFLRMQYVDSYDDEDSPKTPPKKTVLILHGVPGSHKVFTQLFEGLKKAEVRAIVPTFPDKLHLRGLERDELFRHSVEEKTTVFKDFLRKIEVSELDCIIAHSSAVYPALQLLFDPTLKVKSLVLFNTGGHKKPIAMKPYWIIWICSQLYLTSWGRVLVQKSGRFIMRKILFTPIKDDDLDGVCLLAVTMLFSQYRKTKEKFIEISKRQIPTLYCFSENDSVVEKELSYQVVTLLGGSKENVDIHDKSGKLEKSGEKVPWLKLTSFKEGGHYVFRKHPDECLKKVINFLNELDGILAKRT